MLSGQCCLPLPRAHKYNFILTKCLRLCFMQWEGLKINRKSDGGPYPRKLPKVFRTHQATLGREKGEGEEEIAAGWARGPDSGNFPSILWLHFFHCRSHTGPRWGSQLAGLTAFTVLSLGLGSSLAPSHCLFPTPSGLSPQKVSLPISEWPKSQHEFTINKSKIQVPGYPTSSVITSSQSVQKGHDDHLLVGGHGCPWAGPQWELSSVTFHKWPVVPTGWTDAVGPLGLVMVRCLQWGCSIGHSPRAGLNEKKSRLGKRL